MGPTKLTEGSNTKKENRLFIRSALKLGRYPTNPFLQTFLRCRGRYAFCLLSSNAVHTIRYDMMRQDALRY